MSAWNHSTKHTSTYVEAGTIISPGTIVSSTGCVSVQDFDDFSYKYFTLHSFGVYLRGHASYVCTFCSCDSQFLVVTWSSLHNSDIFCSLHDLFFIFHGIFQPFICVCYLFEPFVAFLFWERFQFVPFIPMEFSCESMVDYRYFSEYCVGVHVECFMDHLKFSL